MRDLRPRLHRSDRSGHPPRGHRPPGHLRAGVRPSIEDPAAPSSVNVLGTVHLLESASRLRPLPRFAYASSSSVYATVPARPPDLPPPPRRARPGGVVRPPTRPATRRRPSRIRASIAFPSRVCDRVFAFALRYLRSPRYLLFKPRVIPLNSGSRSLSISTYHPMIACVALPEFPIVTLHSLFVSFKSTFCSSPE